MRLEGKVAIVTGAASGIGRAVALELAKRNVASIAVVDQNESVREVANIVNKMAGDSIGVPFVGDTTDEQFRRDVQRCMTKDHGIPRLCIPAAGITRDALAVKVDKETSQTRIYPVETFRLVTEVNLLAPIYWGLEMIAGVAQDRLNRSLSAWSPEEGVQGAVVFIGSVSAKGNKGQVSYAAAKAGLQGAAATLSSEGMYHGIRCGVVHPGFTDTPMVQAMGEAYVSDKILPNTRLKRLIRTEEIAEAVCFMLGNSAVSGDLWVDGGWRASP